VTGDGLSELEDELAGCDRAIAADPGNAKAHSNRGKALTALGRNEEALASHDRAIALNPGDPVAHNRRGITLADLGRHQDALAAYDQSIALDPGDAVPRSNRGLALVALGRNAEALTAYEDAIVLVPGEFGPHHNRGILLAEMGELDDALAELDRAEGLDPDWAGEGSAWAGAILWHQRDSAGARDRFARVQNRVGGCTPFRTAEMEAVALCGLGQPDEAEQRLLGSLPSRTTGDLAEPRGLYDLLSDPPLPGIDRLRAIADSGT
jgi:tetratricopeptide (TPR) repeat protein